MENKENKVVVGDVIFAEWPGVGGLVPFVITWIEEVGPEKTLCAIFGDGGVVGTEAVEDLVQVEFEGHLYWAVKNTWPDSVVPLPTRDDSDEFHEDWFGTSYGISLEGHNE